MNDLLRPPPLLARTPFVCNWNSCTFKISDLVPPYGEHEGLAENVGDGWGAFSTAHSEGRENCHRLLGGIWSTIAAVAARRHSCSDLTGGGGK